MKAFGRNKTLGNGFILGMAHFFLTMFLVVYSFGEGMARFDEGSPSTAFENFVSVFATVLMQPMYAAYSAIPREIKTNFIEWFLVGANSLLWGFGILFTWRRVCQFKNKL